MRWAANKENVCQNIENKRDAYNNNKKKIANNEKDTFFFFYCCEKNGTKGITVYVYLRVCFSQNEWWKIRQNGFFQLDTNKKRIFLIKISFQFKRCIKNIYGPSSRIQNRTFLFLYIDICNPPVDNTTSPCIIIMWKYFQINSS